jgi:hypothetical protein
MSNCIENFTSLIRNEGTRSGCDKIVTHHFEEAYAQNFIKFLNFRPLSILEIGIGEEGYNIGGASLKMWAAIFPDAKITGIDIYDKSALNNNQIHTHIINQNDEFQLNELATRHGPFDIIIDDGSHFRSDVLTSFFTLFPYLSDGGVYVIEDIMTSYWPSYGGSTLANCLLDTPIHWIKNCVDIIHRNEFISELHHLPNWLIKSLSVHNGIAFLHKGTSDVKYAVDPSSGFYENQHKLDVAMYGHLKAYLEEFNQDPLRYFTTNLK